MKYKINENFFEKIDNEKKAYWLGFLYADGCLLEQFKNDKLKAMVLELSLCKADESHLVKFLNDIGSDSPIKYKTVVLNEKEYFACRVTICCTKLCRDLISLGCIPRKSLSLKYPSSNVVPKEFRNHFIRGYFDGDGCIYGNTPKNGVCVKLSIVGTCDMLNGIQHELLNYKIPVNPIMNAKGNAYEIFIYGYDDIIKIFDLFYSNSSICLERKYEKFKSCINLIYKHKPNWTGVYGVFKTNDKWVARYNDNGKYRRKYFKELEDAKEFKNKMDLKLRIAELGGDT